MASIGAHQSTAEGAAASYKVHHRHGLGPRFDPSYDAEVGRLLATLSSGQSTTGLARGYIELLTRSGSPDEILWTAYHQLVALFAIVYRIPRIFLRHFGSLRIDDAPLVWTQITRLRYLTSDAATGVALPLYSFNPSVSRYFRAMCSAWQFYRQLRRLHRLTGGRLQSAQTIGLTIDFDFTVGAEKLMEVFYPSGPFTGQEAPSAERPADIDQVLFGKARVPAKTQATAYRIDTQDLAVSGGVSAQLKNAIRELRYGNHYPTTPVPALDYGMRETGSGVIVGVVDFGCDFAHASFCDPADRRRSRILALWDQNDCPERDRGQPIVRPDVPNAVIGGERCAFGFGRVFTREKIDRVLAAWRGSHEDDREWPYRALGYDPYDNYYHSTPPLGAHGTIVLDIAAGGRRRACPATASDNPTVAGVASGADIVFVQVRTHKQPDGRRVLDANDVVDAVAFIFHLADHLNRPCVVNLSLNTMSGPHDGDGHLERRLASLLRSGRAGREIKGRSIVIAAGNLPPWESASRFWQHISGVVSPGHAFEFYWNMLHARHDQTRNAIEIWYDTTEAWLELSLEHPSAGAIATIGPGEAAEIFHDGRVVGSIIGSRVRPAIRDNALVGDAAHDLAGRLPDNDRVPGRHVVYISLDPHPGGLVRWKITLRLKSTRPFGEAGPAIRVHAWLERDDEGQTGITRAQSRIHPEDKASTIGTLSCGDDAIVVAAYNASGQDIKLSAHSASGPARHQRIGKPDLSAPGAWIYLVRSKSDTECIDVEFGTSLAAPFVTGTIACLYELNPRAALSRIKEILFSTARKDVGLGSGSAWSTQLGWGRLNPQAAVNELKRQMAEVNQAQSQM